MSTIFSPQEGCLPLVWQDPSNYIQILYSIAAEGRAISRTYGMASFRTLKGRLMGSEKTNFGGYIIIRNSAKDPTGGHPASRHAAIPPRRPLPPFSATSLVEEGGVAGPRAGGVVTMVAGAWSGGCGGSSSGVERVERAEHRVNGSMRAGRGRAGRTQLRASLRVSTARGDGRPDCQLGRSPDVPSTPEDCPTDLSGGIHSSKRDVLGKSPIIFMNTKHFHFLNP
ncbi:hypothetical protein BJ912DRAFT_1039413 [Pholiota molesta]|nr:hypothetical protein BJ912DRAFT_1039413 [Pholiota molesta]